MRIISGLNKGRKLSQITGKNIRPTSDRAREAIFSILGQKVLNAKVLDLFAGTGAMGLEALSRGANHAVFIDTAPQACQIIRENIERCRCNEISTLYCHDLGKGIAPPIKGVQFDLVFMDPPYHQGWIEKIFSSPGFTDLMHPDTVVVAEYSTKENPFTGVKNLDIFRQKKYSKTFVSFLRKP